MERLEYTHQHNIILKNISLKLERQEMEGK